jgi:acetyl esterase/lipase
MSKTTPRKYGPARLRRVIFFAIIGLLVFSACVIAPAIALPFQPKVTAGPTNTALPTETPTAVPTDTPLPTASPTEPPTSTALPPPPTKQVFNNIPYLQVDGVDPGLLSLDIYTPASRGLHPVMVMIHGGSWSGGDKDTLVVSGTKSQFFTDYDFVFVSINYRVSPQVLYPVHVQDVAAALAWISLHIGDYGGDAGKLYVMGHSAGGQLAALVATDERYLAIYHLKPSMLLGVILLDAAGLDIAGTMSPSLKFMYTTAFGENPNTWRAASPVNHVAAGKGIPPFLVTYSYQVVPFTQSSQEFAGKLTAAGVPVREYGAQDKTHASINDDVGKSGDPVTDQIIQFLEETLPGG